MKIRHGHAARRISSTTTISAAFKREVPELDLHVTDDPAEAVQRRRGRLHRRLDQHGPGSGSRTSGASDFAAYQVNAALMATPRRRLLHALPAGPSRRGSDRRSDRRPASVVVQQAANRLHVQKGILAWMLGAQASNCIAVAHFDARTSESCPEPMRHDGRTTRRTAPDHDHSAASRARPPAAC